MTDKQTDKHKVSEEKPHSTKAHRNYDHKPEELVSPFISRPAKFNIDNDLILSAETRLQIDECMAKIKFHKQIYFDWNFKSVDPMGRSVILNFFGPPGTGKTLAAEALAGTLGHEIIQIGIAELESKFLGETATNIQAAFKAADESGAILFFDEADTLLGKRLSSVTQGVDNEVNAMRSTMLIELEKFDGIAIFATNFAKNYDDAFRSRISHHIHFKLPDLEARKKLWARMLVEQIPLEETKEEFIQWSAELSEGFSGREIRTGMRLALPKALMEAEEKSCQPVFKLEHIKSAISQIRKSQEEVGSNARASTNSTLSDPTLVRKMLGVS